MTQPKIPAKKRTPKPQPPAEEMMHQGQRVKSKLERAFIKGWGAWTGHMEVREPDYQYMVFKGGARGKGRVTADFCWPEYRLIVELQGGTFTGTGGHSRGGGIMRDMERHNRLVMAGWRVFYYTPDKLRGPALLATFQEIVDFIGLVKKGIR